MPTVSSSRQPAPARDPILAMRPVGLAVMSGLGPGACGLDAPAREAVTEPVAHVTDGAR